ncbi:MAG TPA: PilZ domain-containing protein [Candidatus Acidoferrales bacterium]|nr:PilZ domain-containing protein [Candidatus Acidoferrales bacterium]
MNPDANPSILNMRIERRVEVHLPVEIRGKDNAGRPFAETSRTENVSRRGAALMVSAEIAEGATVEIRIPLPPAQNSAQGETEFSTSGRVVHVYSSTPGSSRVIGIQFTGRSFQRIFVPESGK